MEKNEEFLDIFSAQNFHNIYDERAEAESDSIDKPMMEFLLKNISHILESEYETIGGVSESELFSHLTGENATLLEKASAGQQNVIRILQDMFTNVLYNEVTFRVIEEPEAHLHPIAQKHLMHIIALMRNHIDSQIVITTHSPYLLAVLQNLLTAGQLSVNPQIPLQKFRGVRQNYVGYCLMMLKSIILKTVPVMPLCSRMRNRSSKTRLPISSQNSKQASTPTSRNTTTTTKHKVKGTDVRETR